MERPKEAAKGLKGKRIMPKNPCNLTAEEMAEFLAWSEEEEDVDVSEESNKNDSDGEIISNEEGSLDSDESLSTPPLPALTPSPSQKSPTHEYSTPLQLPSRRDDDSIKKDYDVIALIVKIVRKLIFFAVF